jgi:predicted kinase
MKRVITAAESAAASIAQQSRMVAALDALQQKKVGSGSWIDGDAEALARRFHETYERLAPDFGYETRKASAVPWENVPEKNKNLMRAVCAELLKPSIGQ